MATIEVHDIYGKVMRTGKVALPGQNGQPGYVQVKLINHGGLPDGGGDMIYVNARFLK